MSTVRMSHRLLLALTAALAIAPAMVADDGLAERNKTTARRIFEERLTQGSIAADAELFTADFQVHVGAVTAGLKEDQVSIQGWKTAIPDLKATVHDVVAEGDRVAVRWSAKGTNTGTGNGLPATGKPLEVGGFALFRMVDGRVAESWGMFDTMGLFRQLGLIENPLKRN
jgi:steroid delta-isomerase-like uncharacterized protein